MNNKELIDSTLGLLGNGESIYEIINPIIENYNATIHKVEFVPNILVVISENHEYIGTIKKDKNIVMGSIGEIDKFSIGIYGEKIYLGYRNEDKRTTMEYDLDANGYKMNNKSTIISSIQMDPDSEFEHQKQEFKAAIDEFFNQVLKSKSKTKKKVFSNE